MGWIVAGVLLVAVIGQCNNDSPPVSESEQSEPTASETMFVRPASANCRATPSKAAASIDVLQRNDSVEALKSEDGWSLIDRPTDCWVRSDLLSDARVEEPKEIRGFSSSPSPSRPRRAAGGSGYFQNCSAARAAGAAPVYRDDPGYSRKLDRDGDGVGCE